MKAVVFHGVGDIRLDEVPEPRIEQATDAIVRLTASAICGTDLHMVRGTMPGMKPGTVLGHEGVGIVEEVGGSVRNLRPGDRVVIPRQSPADRARTAGPATRRSATMPTPMGRRRARHSTAARSRPVRSTGCRPSMLGYRMPMPIWSSCRTRSATSRRSFCPTSCRPAISAPSWPRSPTGDTVAVLGCGPVGQFAILSARLLGADRVLAIDCVPSRLEMARAQGAEVIDFEAEDPTEIVRELTAGIGVDRAIDAVGVDSVRPRKGPAAAEAEKKAQQYEQQVQQIAPERHPRGDLWKPGDAPSQALEWAVQGLAKAGTLSIIGVYPPTDQFFPIGMAMNKNLTIQMGNCNHRKYMPHLVRMVRAGDFDPIGVLTEREPVTSAIETYEAFDRRQPGWIKVELLPKAA